MSNEEQQVTTTLKKVDSVEIDKEYNDKLKGILNEIREVKDIHMEFNTVLKSQEEQIDEIDKNVNMTSTNVDESNTNLIEVSGIQKSVFWKKSFLLTTCTAIVTVPVAVFVGAKAAVVAGVGTAAYGTYNLLS